MKDDLEDVEAFANTLMIEPGKHQVLGAAVAFLGLLLLDNLNGILVGTVVFAAALVLVVTLVQAVLGI